MSTTYEEAATTLDAIANAEEAAQKDPMVTVTMPLSVAIEAYCAVSVVLKVGEEELTTDLRSHRRIPTPHQRKRVEILRAAFAAFEGSFRQSNQP